MDRAELEKLDRESLVQRAQAAGLKRARVLTRPELIDELLRRGPQGEAAQMKRSRGFFGVARDLLSRVDERGLHLPDAAERFRQAMSDPSPQVPRPEAQAIPTVTLAEIYAAQGHKQRALDTLERVLADEPDHIAARSLLEKLQGRDYVSPRDPLPPEPEYEAPAVEEDERDEEAIETPRMPSGEVEIEEEPVPTLDRLPPIKHVPIPREEPLEPQEAVLSIPEPMTVALPAAELSQLLDDRCIAVGGYVWWQLSAASLKLAQDSFFFLRVVTIEPSWDGPRVTTSDVAADPAAGEHLLRDLPRNAVVRVAIGFMPEGEFVPVAHSPLHEVGPGRAVRQWALEAATPSADPLVLAAAERAARL
jgi:hypothetical protein